VQLAVKSIILPWSAWVDASACASAADALMMTLGFEKQKKEQGLMSDK
jgi:hypothetical protein